MRHAAAILAVLALATGCGGDDGADGNGDGDGDGTTAIEVTIEDCLASGGFTLTPSTGDSLAAVTPRGVAFTIAFFPTNDGARAAARKAGAGATAVGTGVVTATSKQRLSHAELDAIEECSSG